MLSHCSFWIQKCMEQSFSETCLETIINMRKPAKNILVKLRRRIVESKETSKFKMCPCQTCMECLYFSETLGHISNTPQGKTSHIKHMYNTSCRLSKHDKQTLIVDMPFFHVKKVQFFEETKCILYK